MTDLLIPAERFTNRIEDFGYEYLSFQARKIRAGETYASATQENELVLVVLGGRCSVESSEGKWDAIGGRRNVFEGRPHALYEVQAGNVGINVDPAAPMAYFPFSGWGRKFFRRSARTVTSRGGVLHANESGGGAVARQWSRQF